MATVYTKLFKKECENRNGITRSNVREALTRPDREQRLASQGLTIIMYSKRMKKGDYLLVNTHVNGKDMMVDLAFRVRKDFVEQTGTDLPFPLMRALAHRFGLPVRVGEHESRFIYNEVIPVSNPDVRKAVRIPNPEKSRLISTIWIRMLRNNLGLLAQCALVFCIDARAYGSWLRGP